MKIFNLIVMILFFSACDNKKKEVIIVKEQSKTTPIKLPAHNTKDSIEGIYTVLMDFNKTDDCNLTIELIKNQSGYNYSLKTNSRNVKGNATFVTNESGEKYVVLEDIPWDEYEGDISNEEDTVRTKEIEIPTGIDFLYSKDTLTIQNYGNAMNYYTKLGECAAKYIQLVKK